MSATTSIRTDRAELAVGSARPGRRLRMRHLWLVPGLALAIFANELGKGNGVSILTLIAFGIAPDLPRLVGINGSALDGARAVARLAFNLVHQPLSPIIATAVASVAVVMSLLPVVWLVGSIVWLGHVVIGWGTGDVPRRDGRFHA
jgi:hypothetical protein